MEYFLGIGVALIGFIILLPIYLVKRNSYNKSTYKKETGNPFLRTLFDKGLAGEYHTSNILERIPGYHDVILNAYIPKKRGKGQTTEIDVIYLHETGIYVLESKNYSGWIFGSEASRNWTQTFPNGKKQSFYNPIMQNRTHMNALKHLLPEMAEQLFTSIIVFSERCTLKKIQVDSPDIAVINRYRLEKTIKKQILSKGKVLTHKQIDELYMLLKPYTQVGEEVKALHIENIKQKMVR